MNDRESKAFLRGEMEFTPKRMMRYIRSRARLATDEDIEDILQNALIMVSKNFDPSHPDANLALYCLGACNKAIAQNLERYHKVKLRKRSEKQAEEEERKKESREVTVSPSRMEVMDGEIMSVSRVSAGKSFDETPSTTSQYRTTSLDSMFDSDDNRSPEEIFGWEYSVLSTSEHSNPAQRAMINNLIEAILQELPPGIHRTCFVLKYVEGYKREDLISCLKMEPKSIDTVDKKIVRTLKAFKDILDQDETRI
ncbi:MAG: hypothetical protein KC777_13925 [Cyanobacteria bacterium HKST-UBA02]|nr:hypothetical protein [Cyanobacteria bacterium HKST-UBA02]